MTLTEARRQYRDFMGRMDVAFAFGHGCSMDGSHPRLVALRAQADNLLGRVRTLEHLAGERPVNQPGACVTIDACSN